MSRSNDIAKAAIAVACAMALIGLVDNLIIQIASHAGLWQFHMIRAMFALPLILIAARVMGWRVRPKRPWAVALRSLFLAGSMMFYFGALAFLSVAEAVAGLFTAPIFVLLITVIWFKEPVSRLNVLAAAVGFAGVALVLRPDLGALDLAVLMPLAGGLLYALSGISTLRICAQETAPTLLAGFVIGAFVISVIGVGLGTAYGPAGPMDPADFMVKGWVAPTTLFLTITAIQATAAMIGIGLLTQAYLWAEAQMVTVFEYVLLIFAAFWAWVLYGDVLDLFGWAGIALICVSGVLLMLDAWPRRASDIKTEPAE